MMDCAWSLQDSLLELSLRQFTVVCDIPSMFAISRKERSFGRSPRLHLALGLICLGSLAHAQYSVVVNDVGWSTASYNWNHVGSFTSLASFGSATATVTPGDNTGTATAAAASVSGNGPDYPHNPNTFDALSSSVDLASVSTAMSSYDTGTDGVYTGNDGGTTYAQMNDHLTFNVGGANGSTQTVIGYTYTVAGYMRQSGSYADGHGEALGSWSLTNGIVASGFTDIKLDSSSGYQPYVNGTTGTGTFDSNTPELFIETGTFTITGPSVGADFSMLFQSWDYNGMDEGYGSNLQFTLPSNVTISSSSGVFASTPVPEPCTLLALLAGSAAILRKRRHSR